MSNQLEIEIHGTNNFSDAERSKFRRAVNLTHKVINSEDFKQRFLSLPLEQTNGMSPAQIYELFKSGKDKFNKESDNDIDVYITMYYSWKKTIGYTYPSTWYTWINRKFFSRFDEAEIAGNIIHEYFHNLGFGHLRASDHNSVPYAVGYLVRQMVREILEGTTPDNSPTPSTPGKKVLVCYRPWKYLKLRKVCYWKNK